ncbi:hypothetical protein LLG95_17880 [bacterium]|nr:hypothetical protein [bacterium]
MALALAGLLMACYGLTGSKLYFGYEGANIDQAEAILKGTLGHRSDGSLSPWTQGGLIEVVQYLPSAAVKLALEKRSALPGLRQLAYTFVLPLFTVLTCLVFYALSLRLWRDRAVAAVLTLILGLGTMLWPYAKFGMEVQITLWTLVAVWALIAWIETASTASAVLFAVALALLPLTKFTGLLHSAVLIAAAAWIVFRNKLASRPKFVSQFVFILIILAIGAFVFLVSNHWRYNGWVFKGRYNLATEIMPYPLWDAVYAVIASPGKSVLFFSPPLIVALWLWSPFLRRFPAFRPIFIGMILIALFHLRNRPWADETWGPRRLHYLVPFMLLPLGCMLENRRAIRPFARFLATAVIIIGLLVQLLAVSFNYTERFLIMGHDRLFAVQYTVWQPRLSGLYINAHLARSMLNRHFGDGKSLPFVWREDYLSWSAPPAPPPPQVFPTDGRDHLDLWYLQQKADWPGRPYWFVSPSSWLVLVFAALGLISAIVLSRKFCRRDAKSG